MAMNRWQSTMDGAKQTERGQDVDGQWAWQAKIVAGTQPAEQALQATTASGFSTRLRPQNTNGPQLAGPAAKTTAAADDVGLSPCR